MIRSTRFRIAFAGLGLALTALPAAAQGGGLTLRAPTQSTQVFARDGSLIAELGPEVRTVVPLRSLPAYVPRAFVAVEDRRFFEHRGVDPVGIARAIRSNLEGDREGASTITQQLIGAMWPERVDRGEITVERKIREARLAVELEQRYGKERILEAYLNQIYFGHGWFGIEAAAQHFFGKAAAKLSIEEAAMLAALPKGPGVFSPKINAQRALERRNLVLDIMAREGVVTGAQAAAAKRQPIRLAPNHGYSVRPPWVIEQVRQHLEQQYGPRFGEMGLRVWTTLDPVAQDAADSALVRGLARVEGLPWFRAPKKGTPAARATASGTPYLQGMVVSVDARTGEILALTGGRDWEDSRFNRALSARRQPGSAFKPLLYSLALDRGYAPATIVADTALSIRMAGSPVYEPRNSDGRFRGAITVRDALVESINTVAVQFGMEAGLEQLPAVARRFGIASPVPAYPSSALGAAVVRPIELAGAYTALANGGMRVEPFLIRRIADREGKVLFDARARGQRALSPATAFLVTDMLRDAAVRGTGREARQRLQPAVPMAGKTGTTDDGADVWYVGYTPEIVSAVWVGFDTPRPIGAGAFGGTVAAPIWGEMMRAVYARRPAPAAWAAPADVVAVALEPGTRTPARAPDCPTTAAGREFFRAGSQPADACVIGRDGAVAALPPSDAPRPDTLGVDTAAVRGGAPR